MRAQSRYAVVMLGVVAIAALALFASRSGSDQPVVDTPAKESALMRSDARVMGDPGSSDVVFVEFLDFECEACGAAYPVVESMREKYEGEITFVARYFPLPGHFNAERAARSVESAARQGKFEEMYQMMYETQEEWGEGREPLDDLFRSYAEELGLDMDQYDADYESQEVADRVQRDVDDGIELGVRGTPTFFLDGEVFQPQSEGDFEDAFEQALASP